MTTPRIITVQPVPLHNMTTPHPSYEATTQAITAWYRCNARPFPWRKDTRTPWGVMVSEIMSHQTPMSRVEPAWRAWMTQWPTPADTARASRADVLVAWGNLGYPRRALRLHEAAAVIAADPILGPLFVMPYPYARIHAPADLEERLLRLPGIGAYTAAAIASFACDIPAVVLDINIRRVEERLFSGHEHPASTPRRAERVRAAHFVPKDGAHAAQWNAAIMELGALVCTARSPHCGQCPVVDVCAWVQAGSPASSLPRRTQAWKGTDRQARGRIMALLRDRTRISRTRALRAAMVSDDPDQPLRALNGLIHDGLARLENDDVTLP